MRCPDVSAKKTAGAQRRSKRLHEKRLDQKEKARQKNKRRNRLSTKIYFSFKKLWSYIWKLVVSVPILYRFIHFVLSLFKDP